MHPIFAWKCLSWYKLSVKIKFKLKLSCKKLELIQVLHLFMHIITLPISSPFLYISSPFLYHHLSYISSPFLYHHLSYINRLSYIIAFPYISPPFLYYHPSYIITLPISSPFLYHLGKDALNTSFVIVGWRMWLISSIALFQFANYSFCSISSQLNDKDRSSQRAQIRDQNWIELNIICLIRSCLSLASFCVPIWVQFNSSFGVKRTY